MNRDVVDVKAIAARFPSFSRVDERHEGVEKGTFERELTRSPRPILLRGLTKRWPAHHRWTFDFLAEKGRGKEVVVTRSVVETARTKRETLDMGSYVRRILEADETLAGGADQTYVSFCLLFELLPELRADIPLKTLFGPLTVTSVAAWVGPAGTITGLHFDTLPNLFAQLRGRKSFILFPPPVFAPYRSPKFDFIAELCQLDLLEIDFDRYPDLRTATPLIADVDEGDGLYIPPGWWHYVVSETPSVSLSCFAGTPRHVLKGVFPQVPKLVLHYAGLYQRNNCSCHNPA